MSAAPETLATGIWGGEQVVLIVNADKAVLRLGCAEGELASPIVLDREGRFSRQGLFSTYGAGPSSPEERAVKAQYDGELTEGGLTLIVRHGASTETYRLVHGMQSKVIRCL